MIQFDEINFIEHLSFNAFNEWAMLLISIRYGRSMFGKITHIYADDIYATNAYRRYSTAAHIVTNFKRKGRAGETLRTQADYQQRVKIREDNTNGWQLWYREGILWTSKD